MAKGEMRKEDGKKAWYWKAGSLPEDFSLSKQDTAHIPVFGAPLKKTIDCTSMVKQ